MRRVDVVDVILRGSQTAIRTVGAAAAYPNFPET